MARGWICARCAAENDEAVASCRACGTIRGGVVPSMSGSPGGMSGAGAPPSAQPSAPVPPPPSAGGPAQPDGWPTAPGGWPGAQPAARPTGAKRQVAVGFFASLGGRLLVILLIGAIGAGVAWFTNASRNSSGQIDKTGDLKPADLRVGDCFDLPGDNASFDPNSTIAKTTAMKCSEPHHYEVFYTGRLADSATYPTDAELLAFTDANCTPAFESYVGTTVDTTTLTYYYFFPDSASWKSGDRGLQCSLADPNLQPLTGSAKGSAR